ATPVQEKMKPGLATLWNQTPPPDLEAMRPPERPQKVSPPIRGTCARSTRASFEAYRLTVRALVRSFLQCVSNEKSGNIRRGHQGRKESCPGPDGFAVSTQAGYPARRRGWYLRKTSVVPAHSTERPEAPSPRIL